MNFKNMVGSRQFLHFAQNWVEIQIKGTFNLLNEKAPRNIRQSNIT